MDWREGGGVRMYFGSTVNGLEVESGGNGDQQRIMLGFLKWCHFLRLERLRAGKGFCFG